SLVIGVLFMLLQPQTSTLFPYTTLFRSEDLSMFSKLEHKFLELVHQDFNFKDVLTSIYQQQLSVSNKKEIDLICEIDPQLDNNLDRKSTRLNSSHVKTSYAVFCLKKKKY